MRFLKALVFLTILLPRSLSASKLREIAMLDISGRPGFETLAFARGYLVMAHDGAGKVDIFDPAKRRFVAEISGIVSPRGVAVDDVSGRVYIADAGTNLIDVVNSRNWQVEDSIQLSRAPENLLLLPGTTNLVETNPYARSFTMLSNLINRVIQIIDICGHPDLMVYDPLRNAILVTVEDQNVV